MATPNKPVCDAVSIIRGHYADIHRILRLSPPTLESLANQFFQAHFIDLDVKLAITTDPHLIAHGASTFLNHLILKVEQDSQYLPRIISIMSTAALLTDMVRKMGDGINVKCTNGPDCDWIGELLDLNNHITNKCPIRIIPCKYNCGLYFMMSDLSTHEMEECDKRPYDIIIQRHQTQLQSIREGHNQQIHSLEDKHNQQISSLDQQIQSLVDQNNQQIQTLEDKHNQQISSSEDKHDQQIHSLEDKHNQQISSLDQQIQSLVDQNNQQIHSLEDEHNQQIHSLEEKGTNEIKSLTARNETLEERIVKQESEIVKCKKELENKQTTYSKFQIM